jgi:hypothetical protein
MMVRRLLLHLFPPRAMLTRNPTGHLAAEAYLTLIGVGKAIAFFTLLEDIAHNHTDAYQKTEQTRGVGR